MALNYGSRQEILRAFKYLQKHNVKEPSEKDISAALYTAGLPDPDLLIRTSGEKRISNFLLWQLAYAEFIFTKTYWPDFNKKELNECINEFKTRDRRYGGIEDGTK